MAPKGETWDLVVDGEEIGTVDIIRRPSSDLIDEISNRYFQASRSSEPFKVVNWTIARMVSEWELKTVDGEKLSFPRDIGKLPGNWRNVIYNEIMSIIEPLVPNMGTPGR